eukprot:7022234-Prymnesium_polylepis.3
MQPPKSRAQVASGGRAPIPSTSSTKMPSKSQDHIIDAPMIKQVSTFNFDETLLYRCCVVLLLLLAVIAIAVAAGGVWNLSNRLQ